MTTGRQGPLRWFLRPEQTLLVAALIAGIVIRLSLIFGGAGNLNSDEAVGGLIGRELLHGHVYWIFPGQDYQGTLEGLVAGVLQPIFGPSAALLKIINASCWLAAAFFLESAARRMRSARPGVVFALAWVSSSAMIVTSTTALTGYGSGPLCCAIAFWAWSHIDRSDNQRWWLFACGVALGAAVWQQPTTLYTAVAFAACTFLVPAIRVGISQVFFVVGGVIGTFPLIVYNVANDWATLHQPSGPEGFGYFDRLQLIIKGLIPRSLGIRLFDGDWTFGRVPSVALLVAFAVLYVAVAISAWRRIPLLRPAIVLLPLNTVGLATFNNTWYVADSRYATSFVPGFALLGGYAISWLPRRAGSSSRMVGAAIAAVIFLGAIVPFYEQSYLRPGDPTADINAIVKNIRGAGFHCALGEYWSVYRLDYLADGAVRAAPDPSEVMRFSKPYEQIARLPGRFVRIATAGSDLDHVYASQPGWSRTEVAGTAIYKPVNPSPSVPGGFC